MRWSTLICKTPFLKLVHPCRTSQSWNSRDGDLSRCSFRHTPWFSSLGKTLAFICGRQLERRATNGPIWIPYLTHRHDDLLCVAQRLLQGIGAIDKMRAGVSALCFWP